MPPEAWRRRSCVVATVGAADEKAALPCGTVMFEKRRERRGRPREGKVALWNRDVVTP